MAERELSAFISAVKGIARSRAGRAFGGGLARRVGING